MSDPCVVSATKSFAVVVPKITRNTRMPKLIPVVDVRWPVVFIVLPRSFDPIVETSAHDIALNLRRRCVPPALITRRRRRRRSLILCVDRCGAKQHAKGYCGS